MEQLRPASVRENDRIRYRQADAFRKFHEYSISVAKLSAGFYTPVPLLVDGYWYIWAHGTSVGLRPGVDRD